jgi:hypothetical protein
MRKNDDLVDPTDNMVNKVNEVKAMNEAELAGGCRGGPWRAPEEINQAFAGFQKYLYQQTVTA